jgi:hypothetical protein
MAFLCPQPSAPATPDYAAAATAQGTANKETALLQGYLNNPNVKGPLGGQTVTFDPVTNQPTITQNLTGTAQNTLDAQQRVQLGMANLGEQGLTSASKIISKPFEYTGPAGIFSLADAGKIQGAPDLTKMGSASGAFTGTNAVGNAVGDKAQGSMFGFGQSATGMGGYGTATGNATSGKALGSVANGVAQGAVANGTAQGTVNNPQASANFQGGQAQGAMFGFGGTAQGNFKGGTAAGGVTGPTLQQSYGMQRVSRL